MNSILLRRHGHRPVLTLTPLTGMKNVSIVQKLRIDVPAELISDTYGCSMKTITQIAMQKDFSRDDIIRLLSVTDPQEVRELYDAAYRIKTEYVGTVVYFRGLIEISNICEKNCYYCGIRKDNGNVERYTMAEQEILDEARQAWQWGYGSVVLQSGELSGQNYADFIERTVRNIKSLSNNELGITLSLGEQSEETYQRWFDAGAHRYLLRIETSNRNLYRTLHPADHDFDRRVKCLSTLGRIGYYLGTGVMIGLPGQTAADLADDIFFFKEIDADMIGMGPFIPHHQTPLSDSMPDFDKIKYEQLDRSLRMIAATRIVLKDINIAAGHSIAGD